MITKTLTFGTGRDGPLKPQLLSVEQAQVVLDGVLRFEAYIFLKPGEITIENYSERCYTDFRGPKDEIAILAAGLKEKLPPAHAHSCWLEHLLEEQLREQKKGTANEH